MPQTEPAEFLSTAAPRCKAEPPTLYPPESPQAATAPHSGGAIGVTGVGSYVPGQVRSFRDTAELVGEAEQWVLERTGIRSRHVAAEHEATSDLAAEAVNRALACAGVEAGDVGLIVVGTTTPDEPCPSTACRVQALVGAHRATAFDVAAACSGWLFAAKTAHAWMSADPELRHAVVVGSETYSRFLNVSDRATAALFGDGAAATVLSRVADGLGFGPFTLGSDGTRAEYAWIPGGGSRRPASLKSVENRDHTLHMDKRAARTFVREVFPSLVAGALDTACLAPGDIAAVVAHQPNPVLLRRAYECTPLPPDRLVVIGEDVGNLGAASLPYALARAAQDKQLRPGDKVLMVAFGAGLTWGSTVLTWSGINAATTPHRLG